MKYLYILVVLFGLQACTTATPTERFRIKYMRYHKEIDLRDFGKDTEAEVSENWVKLHYADGEVLWINRDKVWSITPW